MKQLPIVLLNHIKYRLCTVGKKLEMFCFLESKTFI